MVTSKDPVSFIARVHEVKRVKSLQPIRVAFELDMDQMPEDVWLKLQAWNLTGHTDLRVMVIEPEQSKKIAAEYDQKQADDEIRAEIEKKRKQELKNLHASFFHDPGVAEWLGVSVADYNIASTEGVKIFVGHVKAAYKEKMGVESCSDLTYEQIQDSYRDFGAWKDANGG